MTTTLVTCVRKHGREANTRDARTRVRVSPHTHTLNNHRHASHSCGTARSHESTACARAPCFLSLSSLYILSLTHVPPRTWHQSGCRTGRLEREQFPSSFLSTRRVSNNQNQKSLPRVSLCFALVLPPTLSLFLFRSLSLVTLLHSLCFVLGLFFEKQRRAL